MTTGGDSGLSARPPSSPGARGCLVPQSAGRHLRPTRPWTRGPPPRDDVPDTNRAVLDGQESGYAKVHVDAKTGRNLRATLVAEHAGAMIGPPVLAMTSGLTIGALAGSIVPYPTQADVWKRLGDAYQRTRLTPGVLAFFRRLLAWRR